MSENNRDYQVGRGKPQVHSRFEPAPAADEKVLVNPIARQRKSREQEFRERDILPRRRGSPRAPPPTLAP